MPYLFRSLQLEHDLTAICKLTTQLGYPATPAQILQRFRHIQAQPDYHCYVLEYQKQVVAYIGLIRQWSWQADSAQLIIQAFVVDEAQRGKGIGKYVLQQVEAIAQAQKLCCIKLFSGNRPERYAAHAFYQAQGFEKESLGFKKQL